MWTYRLGLERSKRLLLTGDPLDGRTAVDWGLASECHPEPVLDDAALALCRRIALLPANQLHMMKVLVNQAIEQMGLADELLEGPGAHPRGEGLLRHGPQPDTDTMWSGRISRITRT